MRKDKKNNTSKINLVLLKKIGEPEYRMQFEKKQISNYLIGELIK